MVEFIRPMITIIQALSVFEIVLIISNAFFVLISIVLFQLLTNAVKQSLIIRNIFINFSDSCARIIDDLNPNINSALSNYKEDMASEFKKVYENIRTDLTQQTAHAKCELEKEIAFFQSRLRAKGLEELDTQDIINVRVAIN